VVKTFTSFDGIRIAYHDEGEGPAVILLHGGYVDELGQFAVPIEEILNAATDLRECLVSVLGCVFGGVACFNSSLLVSLSFRTSLDQFHLSRLEFFSLASARFV
jgi:hypothetical protein